MIKKKKSGQNCTKNWLETDVEETPVSSFVFSALTKTMGIDRVGTAQRIYLGTKLLRHESIQSVGHFIRLYHFSKYLNNKIMLEKVPRARGEGRQDAE